MQLLARLFLCYPFFYNIIFISKLFFYLISDAHSMTIFNRTCTFIRQPYFLAASLFSLSVALSGCQPNDTLAPTVTQDNNGSINTVEKDKQAANHCRNDILMQAFQAKQSDRQVQGCGTIIKALLDDNEGSRHQKILIELTDVTPKQTLLLVHNIDLAPRVADVAKGTPISFYGEYVYNDKGGLVHWTHHDPAARHQGGWIDSNGVRYE